VIDDQIMVVVEKASANLYIKVNSLTESVNKKLYFGSKGKASVRKDFSHQEIQRILRKSGIVYVREDILMESDSPPGS